MNARSFLLLALVFGFAIPCSAQDKPTARPPELDALKTYVGIWDAKIEVLPQGPTASSIKFSGVETNLAYGEYWIASDFDSEFMGQTMKVHYIIGYDLDQGTLVGKVIDQGPYAAKMTGDYDSKTKTIRWTTNVKDPNGKPIVQKTSDTQESKSERLLVLSVPGKGTEELVKFMQIKFTKRK